jgi:predicted DNA-binding transcriptional regulator AlpA
VLDKIGRKRTWFKARTDFPQPVVPAVGSASALWEESDVDQWLEKFIEESRQRAAESKSLEKRTAKALQARGVVAA